MSHGTEAEAMMINSVKFIAVFRLCIHSQLNDIKYPF